MIPPPPRSTRTDTPFPYPTLFRFPVPVAARHAQLVRNHIHGNGDSEVLHDREATLLDKGVDQFPDDHHHVIFHLTHATGGKSAVDQLAITRVRWRIRSEEHTSELQSLMRISYAVFCCKKKKT